MLRSAKLVLIGSPSSGKTSIFTRYLSDTFSDTVEPTAIASAKTKKELNGKIDFLILDTAGKEDRQFLGFHCTEAHTIIYVFDATKLTSEQIQDAFTFLLAKSDIHVHFVINKCDLINEEQKNELLRMLQNEISTDDHLKKQKITITFCSAKTGENVKEIFAAIANSAIVEAFRLAAKRVRDAYQLLPPGKRTTKTIEQVEQYNPIINHP